MRLITIFLISLFLSSCYHARYDFVQCTGINKCTELRIKSRRNFEQGIHVKHGNTEIKAGKVEGVDSPLEKVFTEIVTKAISNIDFTALLKGENK